MARKLENIILAWLSSEKEVALKRDNIHIEKIDVFGGGMREAGQKIANTFRILADKPEADYSSKVRNFSKTELTKKPFAMQKKLYGSMERHLDVAIDKVECLARDVRPERQQEIAQVITEQEPMEVGMIAEPEYEYGAEVFVAYQNSKKGAGCNETGKSIRD